MSLLFRYSFPQMLAAYSQYKKKENYNEDEKILGITAASFIALFLLNMVIFIIAIILLAMNAEKMPTWSIILSIFLLLFLVGGPIIVVFMALLIRKE